MQWPSRDRFRLSLSYTWSHSSYPVAHAGSRGVSENIIVYDGWPGHRWSAVAPVVRLPLRLSRHGLCGTFGSFSEARQFSASVRGGSESAVHAVPCRTAACSKSIRPVDTARPQRATRLPLGYSMSWWKHLGPTPSRTGHGPTGNPQWLKCTLSPQVYALCCQRPLGSAWHAQAHASKLLEAVYGRKESKPRARA